MNDAAPPILRIHSPANGAFVGEVPITPVAHVREVVARARAAQRAWGARPIHERCKVLLDVRGAMVEHMDELADLVVRENGKPRPEAYFHELVPCCEALTYFTGEAERILAPEPIPMRLMKHRASYLHRPPRGVVGIIAPWNFPLNLPFGTAAMALIAGNGVVLKPSEFTPLIAERLRQIWVDAGVPADLFMVVHGYGDVGAALVDGGVDMVEFTGSVATGQKVAAMCGERLIPCVMELGGKAPALVFPDCNFERTVDAVTWGGLANSGQVCASIERLVVHESIHDRFVAAVVERVKSLRQGDPTTTDDVDVGSMVNQRQVDIVTRLVDDAVAKGATVATGGKAAAGPGLYFPPTVLTGCTTDMDIVNKETFGPVIPVLKAPDEEAMVAEANRSHLGLLAYVFSGDPDRARRVAERVEAGTVMINDVLATHSMTETPWAGVKQSGIGVTHSDEGLRHMCQQRHVNYDALPWLKKELWWYPYSATSVSRAKRMLSWLYGRGLGRFFRAA
jgi:succinate-semialdehyde dehydrogenase/glutarate-semialdehyde dehydrogenase